MTGILSQVISLTSFGNEFLRSGELEPGYFLNNSVFQYCNLVNFLDFKKASLFSKPREIVIAQNADEWFQKLKSGNCKSIRLYYQSSNNPSLSRDYQTAGLVGGGGDWVIETIYKDYVDYWWNYWNVTNQKATDNKIWSVKYLRSGKKEQIKNIYVDMLPAKGHLSDSLVEIMDFAYKQDLGGWGDIFSKAHKLLSSELPGKDYYYKDLIVLKNYSLLAQQLLFSAGTAWVFGAMGSWNDLVFDKKDDEGKYNDLSAKLFNAINLSVLASVNSF